MSFANLPESGARVIVPDGEELLMDVETLAAREALYVIHNGAKIILCSTIPVGWKQLGINQRIPPSWPLLKPSRVESP